MLIPKQVLEAHRMGDKDSARYALGGVKIERDSDGNPFAVACDGTMIVVCNWDEPDPADYPKLPNGISPEPDGEYSAIIPADACQRASKMPPKRSTKQILERYVVLDEHSPDGKATFAATDLDSADATTVRQLEGRFPIWRTILGSARYTRIRLDMAKLKTLVDTFERIAGENSDGRCVANILIPDRCTAAIFCAASADVRVAAALMPMEGNGDYNVPSDSEWNPWHNELPSETVAELEQSAA